MRRYWCVLVLMLVFVSQGHAFNGITHEQIIKSAFRYLNTHVHLSPATSQWLAMGQLKDPAEQNDIERILIRSTVDVDYQADLWFSAWYHKPFAGGKTTSLGMLSSLYHFLNATKPGVFWEHDGYAYRHTDGTGNDSFLGMSGMIIRGDLSRPLGGAAPEARNYQTRLGIYRTGFKGGDEDWHKLFHDQGLIADAVLPPSNIPAQMAYDAMLNSPRASEDKSEEWEGALPVAEGYIFTSEYIHRYTRRELKGLPQGLDHLGTTLHMVQDLAVPHHAQGLAGYCHQELEAVFDQMACGHAVSNSDVYETGEFDRSPDVSCQNLYDPTQVELLIASSSALDAARLLTMSSRLIEVAKISSQWRWGKFGEQPLGMTLPDKTVLLGDECGDLVNSVIIKKQIQFQYNLAVAASVVILEIAAREYENKNKTSVMTVEDDLRTPLSSQAL